MAKVQKDIRSYIKQSYINIEDVGVRPDAGLARDIQVLNLDNLNAAIDVAIDTGATLFIPGKRYELYGTIDAVSKPGLRMEGAGSHTARLIQYQDNIPHLSVGRLAGLSGIDSQIFSGFSLEYATRQVGFTGSVGISMAESRVSKFRDLLVKNAYQGMAMTSDNNFMYSCEFENIRIADWVDWAIYIANTTGLTGSVWDNIYCDCGTNSFSSAKDVTGGVKLDANGKGGTWRGLNVEWINPTDAAIHLNGEHAYDITSINIEGITSRGGNGLIYSKNSSGKFGTIGMNNLRFRTSDGCTKAAIFVMDDGNAGADYGGNIISVDHVELSNITLSGLDAYLLQSADLSSGNKDCRFFLKSFVSQGGPDILGLANTVIHSASSIRHDPLVQAGSCMEIGGALQNLGNSDYTLRVDKDGRYFQFVNTLTADHTVTLSNFIHSTFKAPRGSTFKIWRSATAVGAFNITINNWDATTIATLAAVGDGVEVIFDGSNWSKVYS